MPHRTSRFPASPPPRLLTKIFLFGIPDVLVLRLPCPQPRRAIFSPIDLYTRRWIFAMMDVTLRLGCAELGFPPPSFSAPNVWPCVGPSIHIINNADTHTSTTHRTYTYVASKDPLPYLTHLTLSFPYLPFPPLYLVPPPDPSYHLRAQNEQGYPCPTVLLVQTHPLTHSASASHCGYVPCRTSRGCACETQRCVCSNRKGKCGTVGGRIL
jgi:hypothetical protein